VVVSHVLLARRAHNHSPHTRRLRPDHPSMKPQPVISRRFILSIVALVVIDSILDNGVSHESRRLEDRDTRILQSPIPEMGAHFVTLNIGEPAQPQRLMVSLSTAYTSFPCSGCVNCGSHHTGKYFNFTNSLIHTCPGECAFRKSACEDGSNQCIVSASQTAEEDIEGALRGFELRDIAQLNMTGASKSRKHRLKFNLDFVCTMEIRGITQDLPGDGLLSLSTASSSFISQMHAKGIVKSREFSLCFNHADDSQVDGTSLGTVNFGDINRDRHSSALVWALNRGKDNMGTDNYVVSINNIYMGVGGGSNPLLNAARGTMSIALVETVVDVSIPPNQWMTEAAIQTNKPFTVLPKTYESAFYESFSKLAGASYDQNGILMTKKVFDSMPTIFLQIEPHKRSQGAVTPNVPGLAGRLDALNPFDIILAIPAHNYLSYNTATRVATPTIQFSDKFSFLGANVLQGHELVFDLDNHRIGFAEISSCDGTTVLAKSKGRSINDNKKPAKNTTGSENENSIDLSKASRSGEGNGIFSELDERGYSKQAELEKWKGNGRGRGRGIDPTSASSENVTTVGGKGSQSVESTSGIPPASGGTTLHAGPGALDAATKLNGMNSKQAVSVDWFHVYGFLLLLSSFGITAYATRDKTDSRESASFKSSAAPLLDPDLEKNAWASQRRSIPGFS
jgi:hypothetical protein